MVTGSSGRNETPNVWARALSAKQVSLTLETVPSTPPWGNSVGVPWSGHDDYDSAPAFFSSCRIFHAFCSHIFFTHLFHPSFSCIFFMPKSPFSATATATWCSGSSVCHGVHGGMIEIAQHFDRFQGSLLIPFAKFQHQPASCLNWL